MKTDYKKTKLGLIPEDWEVVKLGDVCAYVKGYAFKSKDYSQRGIRIIRVSDTNSTSIVDDNPVYIASHKAEQYSKWELRKNDLIFSTVGSRPPLYSSMVGNVVKVEKKYEGALLNQNAVVIRGIENRVDQEYLYPLFKVGRYLHHIITIVRGNANQVSITLKDLFSFQIPRPPLPEQARIADCLSQWDRGIALLERLIAQKEEQKKGLMQQLLTGRQRLPGFAGEWERVKIKDVAKVNPPKLVVDDNVHVSFVGMADVSERGQLVSFEERLYSDVKKGFTSFKDGDVLVAKITPCFENGKGAFVEGLINGIGFGSTEFIVIRSKGNVEMRLLYYFFHSSFFRKKGEANMTGSSGQKRVSRSFIENFSVPLPPLPEQKAIAAVLNTADRELSLLGAKLGQYRLQKRGLMQQLLMGRKRLV